MPDPGGRFLTCRVKRGAAVLALRGPLRAGVLREALAAVKRGGWSKVVLDLRGTGANGCCSREDVLQTLLGLRRRLRDAGRRLVLCGLPGELTDLFRATWLLGLFEVQPDVAAALASLTR